MTAATLKSVLQGALAGNYAVAGLVVLGWEDACAYVEAADETGIPIILQAGPGCRKHTPVSVLGKMFRHLADQARVPVVCHIDHAYTLDECAAGIDNGFTSVMIDGSKLPISDNIELTRRVVATCKTAWRQCGRRGRNSSAMSVAQPRQPQRQMRLRALTRKVVPTPWRFQSAMSISTPRKQPELILWHLPISSASQLSRSCFTAAAEFPSPQEKNWQARRASASSISALKCA